MKRHQLGGKVARVGQDASDRNGVRVEAHVWDDEFEDHRYVDPARSIPVTITISAAEPSLAVAVAQDVGELVAQVVASLQSEAAAALAKELRARFETAVAEAARQNELLEGESAHAVGRHDRDPDLHMLGIAQGARMAEQRASIAAAALIEAQMQASDGGQSGHLVHVLDPGVPFWRDTARGGRLAREVTLSLGLAVVLATILVGAFYPSVMDEQDLLRVGLTPLGKVRTCGPRTLCPEVKLRRAIARRAFPA
jgi:hypothetical protein